MKKTRVKLIVKEFYKQMNPDMWDGSGERPDLLHRFLHWKQTFC